MTSSPAPENPPDSPQSEARQGRFRAWTTNATLALITLLVFFAIGEVTLRLMGVDLTLKPADIEFGHPLRELIQIGFEEDSHLFWVPQGYYQALDILSQNQPPWILMGDSCVQLAGYDRALAQRVLDTERGRLRYGNLAVAGWTTFQGHRQAARDLKAIGPQVVTFSYGWNDHWIGFGLDDRGIARTLDLFSNRWGKLRWVQLVTRALVQYRARGIEHQPNRVSLDDFKTNMTSMVHDIQAIGATPMILTSASNHEPGKEPQDLGRRWLRDVNELIPLHASYIEIQRQVAESTGVPICDLAAIFDALPKAERDAIFMDDGIHYSEQGSLRVAAELDMCFERYNLWAEVLDP